MKKVIFSNKPEKLKPFHFGGVDFQNERVSVNMIFFNLSVECCQPDIQQPCCFGLITISMLQYFLDVHLFYSCKIENRKRRIIRPQFKRQVL